MRPGRAALPLATSLAVAAILGLGGCARGLPPPEFERFDRSALPSPSDYPDAPAVVLLDRGELRLTVDPKLGRPVARLRRLRRVLVLTPSGGASSTVEVPLEPGTRVLGFRVRVTWPDGRVDERSDPRPVLAPDGLTNLRLALPEAQPGTVVEAVHDTWYTDLRFLPPWRFDDTLPTRRSTYAVVVPPSFSVDLRFSEDGRFVDRPPERFETPDGVRFSWSRTHLAPRRPEPGMPSPELLAPRAHVLFRTARIGTIDHPGFTTWDDVATWLLGQLPTWDRPSEATRARAIRAAGEGSEPARALRLLAWVAETIESPSGPPRPLWRAPLVHPEAALAAGEADPASRGLLLVALLRAAGIGAVPAVYTRRGEDVLLPDAPTVRALDGLVAVLPRPTDPLVLDPSHLAIVPEAPAPDLQGQRLVLIDPDGVGFLRAPAASPGSSRTEVAYTLHLEPTGDVRGTLEARLTGAEAAELRARLRGAPPDRFPDQIAAFLAARGAPLAPTSLTLAHLATLDRPLALSGTVEAPRLLSPGEGPEAFHPLERLLGGAGPEPPIHRRSPLLLPGPREIDVRISLRLPEGWRAVFAPPEVTIAGPAAESRIGARRVTERRLDFFRGSRSTALQVPPEAHDRFRQAQLDRAAALLRTFGIGRPAEPTFAY